MRGVDAYLGCWDGGVKAKGLAIRFKVQNRNVRLSIYIVFRLIKTLCKPPVDNYPRSQVVCVPMLSVLNVRA